MIELITLAFVIIPIALAGLLSASETAMTALSLAKIHRLKTDGNKRAVIISRLREDKESLISTILIANSIFNILASTVATAALIKIFGDEGVIYATILMTVLIILFAEILPKTYAIAYPEQVALSFAYFLKVSVGICKPITKMINFVVLFIIKTFKMHKSCVEGEISPTEEIRGTIEIHHKQGYVDQGEKYMFDGIFYLSENNVGRVMTHRKNMYSINIDLDVKDLISQIQEIGYTRIPIWQDNPDNIVGVLNTKHLLNKLLIEKEIDKIKIKDLVREPVFVHENTSLGTQLSEFKRDKNRFAIVIDEYGDIQGLVTSSDILEEVVGSVVHDEHEKAKEEIVYSNGFYTVRGDLSIRDINRILHWTLPEEEASTIAGLLIHELERIPDVGENFISNGFNFTILAKEANQLTIIRIKKLENA
jgi:Mg2+/Co2+ transporter CorB